MKVILNKDIPNLGEEGEIKNVARGYARNFLIPNQLVMPYTADALAILESRREQLSQRREEKRKGALDIKTRIETEDLTLEMPAGDRGRLFGSVTSATIVEALASKGISVERKRLEIPEKTIKSVGTTRVRVRLYGDEEAELKVIVVASGAKPETAASTADGDKAAPAPAEASVEVVADAAEEAAEEVAEEVAEESVPEVEASAAADAGDSESDDADALSSDTKTDD